MSCAHSPALTGVVPGISEEREACQRALQDAPTDGLQPGWTAVRGDDCATLVRQNLCPWSGDIWGKRKQINLI